MRLHFFFYIFPLTFSSTLFRSVAPFCKSPLQSNHSVWLSAAASRAFAGLFPRLC
jgi:hypothetical protein